MVQPLGFGGEPLASYACDWRESRGRLFAEPDSPTRTGFQRDRDRIIHSTAFRRLNHKTQVFVFHEGDHYRTRLTHSLEVSQIARSLARAFRIDEALAEALALAHDLGHPPFGHDGERALQIAMADYGGFDHNAQSLRVVTKLEQRYAEFDGLNLTWESLEGLVKHNGPVIDHQGQPFGPFAGGPLPFAIQTFQQTMDLELASFASLEAQVAAVSDDIAYNAHDLDDGLRARLIDLDALRSIDYLASLVDQIEQRYPGLSEARTLNEVARRMITNAVEDTISETIERLKADQPATAQAVRLADRPQVAHSEAFSAVERQVKAFLKANLYRHPDLLRIRDDARQILLDLFKRYWDAPHELPEGWQAQLSKIDEDGFARVICDYVAGMTDWYAMSEHRRLFDATPELR